MPEFRVLYGAMVLGGVAHWTQQFAVGWLLVQMAVAEGDSSRGALYLGFAGLSRLAPQAVLGIVAGLAADHIDRRRILLFVRALALALAFVLALVVLLDRASVPFVLACTFLSAVAFAFDQPAMVTHVPAVVGRRDIVSGIAITRATSYASALVGPLIAGVLIGPLHTGGVVAVAGGLWLLSLPLVWRLSGTQSLPWHSQGALGSLREAASYALGDPTVRTVLVGMLVFTALGQSVGQLLPAVAQDTLRVGATELSWLVGALGLGALAGSAVVATIAAWPSPNRVVQVAAIMFAVATLMVGLQRGLWEAVAWVALAAALGAVYFGSTGTLVHMSVPDALRGRIVGFQFTVWQSGTQLGTVLLGTLGSVVGVSTAIVAGGIVLVLVALVLVPAFGRMRMPTS